MGDEAAAAPSLNVLVVDDEPNIRKTLALCLEGEGHRVIAVGNFQDAVAESSRRSFDLAFVDLRLGTTSGLDLIPALLATAPWLRVIVITAFASIDTAVEAMRRGATDYIPKPFTPAQVTLAVRKVSEVRSLEQRVAALREDLERAIPETDFSSASHAMRRAVSLSPAEPPDLQVQVLGLLARAARNRNLLLRMQACTSSEEVVEAVREWEAVQDGGAAGLVR